MQYDTLLNAAQEYCEAQFNFQFMFPNGIPRSASDPHGFGKARLWNKVEMAEAVLDALSEFSEIPREVMINAVRIENRYYERGGTELLSAERLIRSLLPA